MSNQKRLPEGRLELEFDEWKPALDEADAIDEANRCLYCHDAPCIQACPTGIDIPVFIRKIATGNSAGAARAIFDENVLGYSCARVCPVEVLCAGACVYVNWKRPAIQIGKLQRYAIESAWAENAPGILPEPAPATGKRVAMIGGGPASIAAATLLAHAGHQSTIFDRRTEPGGLNTFGVAPYKMFADEALNETERVLPKERVDLRNGIEIVENAENPEEISIRDLLSDFDAVFIGTGIGGDKRLGIPGEPQAGTYHPQVSGATWWIEQIKANPGYKLDPSIQTAVVIGGGNTALDAAHELKVLNIPNVLMIYRKDEATMTGYKHELKAARQDGVSLIENSTPVAFVWDDDRLVGLRVRDVQEGPNEAGDETVIPADLVVVSIGQDRSGATQVVTTLDGVETDPQGRVVVNPETHRTGNDLVWAAGDCVNGGKEVVNAVAEAKVAVNDILRHLRGE